MSDRQPAARVIYVASVAHSGSTLLDLVLGAHSRVQSLGELKVLTRRRAAKRDRVLADRCTCGAPDKQSCPFWSAVDGRLRAASPAISNAASEVGLPEIDLDPTDVASFERHNRALFEASCHAGQKPWLVDSSKSPRRLRRLLHSGAFDVRTIHLTRSPHAVAYSHVRKGRSSVQGAVRYARSRLQLEMLLARVPHLRVRYEDLATTPAAELQRVMTWLGLDYEPEQLDWTSVPHHNVCGNRMRFATTPEIQLDDAWREALSPLQRVAIRGLTWPAQLASRALALNRQAP